MADQTISNVPLTVGDAEQDVRGRLEEKLESNENHYDPMQLNEEIEKLHQEVVRQIYSDNGNTLDVDISIKCAIRDTPNSEVSSSEDAETEDDEENEQFTSTEVDGNPISWLRKKLKKRIKKDKRTKKDQVKLSDNKTEENAPAAETNLPNVVYPRPLPYPRPAPIDIRPPQTSPSYPHPVLQKEIVEEPLSDEVEESFAKYERDTYDFNYKRRGQALVFSFDEYRPETKLRPRDGATREAMNISILLKLLGFKVNCNINQTKTEMERTLDQAARDNHFDEDCFVCVLMTHGTCFPKYPEPHIQESNDIIYAKDGFLYLDDILKRFREDKCASLANKPKLFFVQACRGNRYSKKVPVPLVPNINVEDHVPHTPPPTPRGEGEGEYADDSKTRDMRHWMPMSYTSIKHPCYKDFLVAYSTLPGYFSYRRKGQSWFIFELWKQIKTCCNDLELIEILERVNLVVAYSYAADTLKSPHAALRALHGTGQMPWVMSMLTKEVYLRPKVPDMALAIQKLWWQ